MSETLQEYVDSRGVTMRVDREQGVIRGVKVLGLRSRNGRTYLAEALEKAIGLYEGARVNVNHPKASPLAARDYQDRIGHLRNVMIRAEEGLFADFHFNPKHALAEQLLWDAEHAPGNVGFSHNVLARTARRGEQTVVEVITRVQSVDLVADPATTEGLFEAVEQEHQVTPTADEMAEAVESALSDPANEPTDSLEQLRENLARAEAELERLRVAEALSRRRLLIHELLSEAGLSGPANGKTEYDDSFINERFIETLLTATDETSVRELVRDRAELVERLLRRDRPRSRDQSTLNGRRTTDAASFVRAIT